MGPSEEIAYLRRIIASRQKMIAKASARIAELESGKAEKPVLSTRMHQSKRAMRDRTHCAKVILSIIGDDWMPMVDLHRQAALRYDANQDSIVLALDELQRLCLIEGNEKNEIRRTK